jgi:hypothetical protein
LLLQAKDWEGRTAADLAKKHSKKNKCRKLLRVAASFA